MITERPHSICYSKNEIRYVFLLDNLTRDGLSLQVNLYYKAIGEVDYTLLNNFGLKPTAEGYVYLYIQAYLDSVVNHVLPIIGQVITDAADQAKHFYIEYREVEDADINPDWNADENTHIRMVLKGGIERHKASRNNIFINYIDTEKPFLTWQPTSRFIYADEPAYLTFLNTSGLAAGSKIEVSVTDTASNNAVSTIPLVDDSVLYHLDVSATALDIDSILAGTKYFYTIRMLTVADAVLAGPYKFYLEYRPNYACYDLMYINSLGGVDPVRVIGDTEINIDRTTDDFEGGLKLDDWTSSIKPPQRGFASLILNRMYKGDIGYLRTKARQEAFLELFVSKAVYMNVDDRWVPVINLQKSQKLGTVKDKIQSFPIEWALSESNEVFTPAAQVFGTGEDNETYG